MLSDDHKDNKKKLSVKFKTTIFCVSVKSKNAYFCVSVKSIVTLRNDIGWRQGSSGVGAETCGWKMRGYRKSGIHNYACSEGWWL